MRRSTERRAGSADGRGIGRSSSRSSTAARSRTSRPLWRQRVTWSRRAGYSDERPRCTSAREVPTTPSGPADRSRRSS